MTAYNLILLIFAVLVANPTDAFLYHHVYKIPKSSCNLVRIKSCLHWKKFSILSKQVEDDITRRRHFTNSVLYGHAEGVNDILRGIGLTPVSDMEDNSEKLKKHKTIGNGNANSQRKVKKRKEKKKQLQAQKLAQRSNSLNPRNEIQQLLLDMKRTQTIPLQTQLDYARNGHTVLRSFLSPELIRNYLYPLLYKHHHSNQNSLSAWQQKVEVAASLPSSKVQKECPTVKSCKSKLKQILQTSTVEIPFLQHFNTWRTHTLIKQIVTSPLLASTASTLLDVPSVRLYQDALFVKDLTKDGPTPWHSDAKMAPFDTSHFITFWIPLQYIPKNFGTGLRFVDKSHLDFALPFWNEDESAEYDRLEERYSYFDNHHKNYGAHEESTCVKDHMPLNVGDVTVHAGWTLHCADAGNIDARSKTNKGEDHRYALAVTFVDAKAEVREEYYERSNRGTLTNKSNSAKRLGDAEDQLSFRDWITEVNPRERLEHPLIPIVWPC